MVKSLDDMDVASIDHIGLWLWRAAIGWRSRMRTEMAARGFPWHSEARGPVASALFADRTPWIEVAVFEA